MVETAQNAQVRLVAIGEDGTLQDPDIDLSPDDRQACGAMADLYRRLGFQPPWLGFVSTDRGRVVGGCAFVGPPADNRVEIAYYTAPDHQGKGYATAAAQCLVAIARDAAPGIQLTAKTEPRRNPSTRILTGLGFAHVGSTVDDEIGEAWLWLLEP